MCQLHSNLYAAFSFPVAPYLLRCGICLKIRTLRCALTSVDACRKMFTHCSTAQESSGAQLSSSLIRNPA